MDSAANEFIQLGFGDSNDSENSFDAFVGLYGIINVIQNYCTCRDSLIHHISTLEVRLFGQKGLAAEVGVERNI
jgi:hypothetical protein